jgi:hypothetical protein
MTQWLEDIEASKGHRSKEAAFRSVRDLVPGEHYEEHCLRCDTLMGQCRCSSPNRSVVYGVCSDCQTPEEKEAQRSEYEAALAAAMGTLKTAVKTKPSLPGLVDKYEPTDENLWKLVLEVASGKRLKYERSGREINAPNGTRGYDNMPHNPNGIAWAVKQYKGFGGNFKNRKEAADKVPEGLADDAPKALDKEASWEKRLERMAAGGIEVTVGADAEAQRLAAEGTIRLASQDGLRWYWDLTEKGRQAALDGGTGFSGVSPDKD